MKISNGLYGKITTLGIFSGFMTGAIACGVGVRIMYEPPLDQVAELSKLYQYNPYYTDKLTRILISPFLLGTIFVGGISGAALGLTCSNLLKKYIKE